MNFILRRQGKSLKRFPLFMFITLLLSQVTYAQSSEVGFGIGGFKYSGDLSRGMSIKSVQPAVTAFYRSNISDAVSFRVSITGGGLSGSDQRTPIDPFAEQRDAGFNIFLFEAATVFEYHFLKWRDEAFINRWTPYFFGGIGLFGVAGVEDKPVEYSNIQPAIPFGLGIKYILNPKWYVGMEFGARKTFFDYLDNVSDGDGAVKNYQYGNRNDSDLYYFLGVTLTYSFYTIPCPTSPYKRYYRSK